MSRRIRRTARGHIQLRLSESDRAFLHSVVEVMRELLETPGDEATARLFPNPYPDDRQREQEYRLLAHTELLESHLAALEVLEKSADADRLDDEQANAWIRALNEIRLVLGSRLDLTDDGPDPPLTLDDPRLPVFAAYDHLTRIQGELVDALAR
ncbi:MAG: DUF2017 domain-containing protein [Actinomycetota bacterium]|nr:DUF2017 domain-containing protein [Actinomycetota bacterium]